MPSFWRVLIINQCWILSKAFSASIEISIWFLIFHFVILVYRIDWFAYIEDKLGINPGINSTWSRYMIFLMHYWFLFARILLKIFPSIFISDIGLYFSFFVLSLSGFAISVIVASYNEFGNVPSSAVFWKSFRKIVISSSLNVWQNFPIKSSCPGL